MMGFLGVNKKNLCYKEALKCLRYILALKCFLSHYSHFDHLCNYLIVYIYLFMLVSFQNCVIKLLCMEYKGGNIIVIVNP